MQFPRECPTRATMVPSMMEVYTLLPLVSTHRDVSAVYYYYMVTAVVYETIINHNYAISLNV